MSTSNDVVQLGSVPLFRTLQKVGIGLSVVGIIGLAAVYAVSGMERMMADYLLGFWFFTGISVTCVFFSALQFLVRAGWSASIRRIAENFTGLVPIAIIGLIPIVVNILSHHSIYEWSHAGVLTTDPVLAKKAPWFDITFFLCRLAGYAALWFLMAKFVIGNSLKQDSSGADISPTRKNWKRAAPWVLNYAITITFASFDLLMSLEPHWFSTIWGVYTFAGHFVGALACITLLTVALYNAGHLRQYITAEHFHDLGKLMFAFSVFWTYIAFSQYFIIWYANLPEETIYFTYRLEAGWQYVGFALVIMHFIVPFMVLLRQDVKRKTTVLVAAAIIILVSHFIDLAWIILPAVQKVASHGNHGASHGIWFGWQEITGWLLFAGLFLVTTVRNFQKRNAVAINDPLLSESVEYVS
jgi:hypothetical protein